MPHSPRVEKINKKGARRAYPKIFDDRVYSCSSHVNISDEGDECHGQIEQSNTNAPVPEGDCPEKQKNSRSDETDDINHPDPQLIFKIVMVLYP